MRCHCRLSVQVNTHTLKSRFQHRWRMDEASGGRRSYGLACRGGAGYFLGPSIQRAKSLISEGQIGDVVSAVGCIMTRGMEHRHPNPQIYRDTKREWEALVPIWIQNGGAQLPLERRLFRKLQRCWSGGHRTGHSRRSSSSVLRPVCFTYPCCFGEHC